MHSVDRAQVLEQIEEIDPKDRYCRPAAEGRRLRDPQLLERAIDQIELSACAYDRILHVARTIADLAGEEKIRSHDIAEAIQYRALDRGYFKN